MQAFKTIKFGYYKKKKNRIDQTVYHPFKVATYLGYLERFIIDAGFFAYR